MVSFLEKNQRASNIACGITLSSKDQSFSGPIIFFVLAKESEAPGRFFLFVLHYETNSFELPYPLITISFIM